MLRDASPADAVVLVATRHVGASPGRACPVRRPVNAGHVHQNGPWPAASHLLRRANCISATCARRSSPGWRRVPRAGRSSCGWRTSTASRRRPSTRPSARRSGGHRARLGRRGASARASASIATAPDRRLTAAGRVYPCYCTRREIRAEIEAAASAPHVHLPDGAYPGHVPRPHHCRALRPGGRGPAPGAAAADRRRADRARRSRRRAYEGAVDDVVLARADGVPGLQPRGRGRRCRTRA